MRRLLTLLALALPAITLAPRSAAAQDAPAAPPAPAVDAAAPAPAAGAPAPAEAAPPSPTAGEILDGAKAAWEKIKDYHCEVNSWTRRGDETRRQILDFTLKRPLSVRSVVLDGYNKGGIATRDADGAMRGRKGGVLSIVTLTIEEDDERIVNLRGVKFYNANWGAILKEFQAEVDLGWEMKRGEDIKIKDRNCHQISIEGTKPENKLTRDVLCVDAETHLITKRALYEGTVKVSETLYTKAELNLNPADELFHL